MRLGAYTVIGELGRGASARVLKARDPRGLHVAIKVLTHANKREAYARFAREQSILETLRDTEGFVPIIDSGETPDGPYFVMPLLAGGTLRTRLEEGALGINETCELGRRIASAIGRAHEKGIVHRDLKPENILFTEAGQPLIADLGIARYVIETSDGHSTSSDAITQQGAFLGTPAYMSPEQMTCSKSVDARADVFSLGAILYECLCGRPPFAGATLQETVARTMRGNYVSIYQARVDAPFYLALPIHMALSLDPSLRYSNGVTFSHGLGVRRPKRRKNSAADPGAEDGPPRPPRRRKPRLGMAWLAPFTPLLMVPAAMLVAQKPTVHERAAPPASPTPAPKAKPVVRRGWSGESLPEGLRKGTSPPVYIFDTKKGLELELVYVPSGDFFMGAFNGGPNEKPLHTHPMPRGYYIGRTPITWGQYRTFCGATGRASPEAPAWPTDDTHPVVNVTWNDSVAFCAWAGLALPGEAEWEKAARGDDTRMWPWGNTWLPGRANVLDQSCPETTTLPREADDGFPYTAPAGSFPAGASPYGALDMCGNVLQWCSDWYSANVYTDYAEGRWRPPATGSFRVARGGCWTFTRWMSTVTYRPDRYAPEFWRPNLGFRVCLRLPN
jgi:serine/threonine-protein kinase